MSFRFRRFCYCNIKNIKQKKKGEKWDALKNFILGSGSGFIHGNEL